MLKKIIAFFRGENHIAKEVPRKAESWCVQMSLPLDFNKTLYS